MPAPTPIQIRYDNPAMLARLAAAAGSASYDQNNRYRQEDRADSNYRMEYQGYLQRLAGDRAMVNADLDRRTQANRLNSENAFRSDVFAREGEAQNRAFALQGVAQAQAQARQQVEARRMGSATIPGRSAMPVSLVPADDTARPSSATATINGVDIRRNPQTEEFERLGFNPDANAPQWQVGEPKGGFVRAGSPDQTISPETKSQRDYLTQLQGQIPTEQWNSLWVAANSGGLSMDQLMDNVRQVTPKVGSSRSTASNRAFEKYAADLDVMRSLTGLSPSDQLAYGRRRFGMQDNVIFSDQDVQGVMESYVREAVAATTPVTNSGGRTPTGGNPVDVGGMSPDQVRATYPSGTWIIQNGETMRVP